MHWLSVLIFASSAFPMLLAWQTLRRSSMAHAVVWTILAWAMWGGLLAVAPSVSTEILGPCRYAGLCLIGSAGVAVLGARRPGVGAWNFVVVGLLAVFALSWAEGLLTQTTVRLGAVRAVFLTAMLAVGIVNYLPTRLAAAAALLGVACSQELWSLLGAPVDENSMRGNLDITGILLGLVPWCAWAMTRIRPLAKNDFDRVWLEFRDRYGLVWAARLREQFNRSAANAALAVELTWSGLRSPGDGKVDGVAERSALEILQALMKRFGVAQ